MKCIRCLLVAYFALAITPLIAASSFRTNQAADVVLGQSVFTTNTAGHLPNQFHGPSATAVDPTTGKLFVCDQLNSRVLRFSSAAASTSGANPEAVIGQASFAGNSANQGGGAAANTLNAPLDVYVDAAGSLWVADTSNNRVLRFTLASSVGATNASADLVIGQPDFTSTTRTPFSGAKLAAPSGLTVDSAGRLWVADTSNSRVLRFDNIDALPNGASASGVLGHPNFTTISSGLGAAMMSFPSGVSIDSAGRLWVADTDNNRVLRFDDAAAKPNGADADGVLGQPDFTMYASGLAASRMSLPSGVYADPSGNLWVSEQTNRRAIRFSGAAALADGAAATLVLGQPDFETAVATTTALGGGLFYHLAPGPDGSLFVADYGNNRVLRYTPKADPIPTPAPPVVTISGKRKIVTTKRFLALKGGATNAVLVEVKIGKAVYKRARGTTQWKFTAKLKAGRNPILVRAVSASGATSTVARAVAVRR